MAEDEMVGWHHQLSGHKFEQTLGESEGREACCAAVPGVAKSWNNNLQPPCLEGVQSQSGL